MKKNFQNNFKNKVSKFNPVWMSVMSGGWYPFPGPGRRIQAFDPTSSHTE